MGALFEHHDSFFWRTYSDVNIQNGAVIIDDPDNPGKPLREDDGKLAVRSLTRQPNGQPRFKRLVSAVGKPIRLQQCAKLADVSDNKTKNEISQLALDKDNEILAWEEEAAKGEEQTVRPDGNMLVTDFVETIFLPWADKNKEASTARSYRTYWNAYLKPHFNHSKTLKGYAAYQGTALLEKLAAEYSANTINHIRALASTIFKHATAKGYIKQNPWRDVVLTAEGQETKETVAHTEEEVERVIDALERVTGREEYSAKTAAMAIAVGYGLGLRPSEIAGLRWEHVDLDKNRVHIRHAFVAGNFKGTKTNKRRILNMDPSLLNRMKLWASGQGYPTSGWVFPAQRGDNPINMTALSARVIKTTLKKLGLEFSFYGLRRGFGTALVLAGATLTETADALGNTEEIVERHYFIDKENVPAAKGMQKLNAARAAKRQGLSESEFPEPLTLAAEGAGNE